MPECTLVVPDARAKCGEHRSWPRNQRRTTATPLTSGRGLCWGPKCGQALSMPHCLPILPTQRIASSWWLRAGAVSNTRHNRSMRRAERHSKRHTSTTQYALPLRCARCPYRPPSARRESPPSIEEPTFAVVRPRPRDDAPHRCLHAITWGAPFYTPTELTAIRYPRLAHCDARCNVENNIERH